MTTIKCRMTDCMYNANGKCVREMLVIGKFKTCFGYYLNQEAAKGGCYAEALQARNHQHVSEKAVSNEHQPPAIASKTEKYLLGKGKNVSWEGLIDETEGGQMGQMVKCNKIEPQTDLEDTQFSCDCLKEISDFLNELDLAYKRNKAEPEAKPLWTIQETR